MNTLLSMAQLQFCEHWVYAGWVEGLNSGINHQSLLIVWHLLSCFAKRSFAPGVVNATTDILDDQGDNYRGFSRRQEAICIAYGLILPGLTVQLFTLKPSTMIAVSMP